mgnify:CR=1 FL=1
MATACDSSLAQNDEIVMQDVAGQDVQHLEPASPRLSHVTGAVIDVHVFAPVLGVPVKLRIHAAHPNAFPAYLVAPAPIVGR